MASFNNIEHQGTPPGCGNFAPLRALCLQCEHCFQIDVVIHLCSMHPLVELQNNLHELLNIYFSPPKDQIMEETTNIEHIKYNSYMQLYFIQNFQN